MGKGDNSLICVPTSLLFGILGALAIQNSKGVEGMLMIAASIASFLYHSSKNGFLRSVDILVSYTVGLVLIFYLQDLIVTLLVLCCWLSYKMNGEKGSYRDHMMFVHSIAIVTFAYIVVK